MSEKIIDRIKKLLRLAEDEGATEGEAAAALAKATELMTIYGIERAACADRPGTIELVVGERSPLKKQWHLRCAEAAGLLFNVRVLQYRSFGKSYAFVGREENVRVAELTTEYIIAQICTMLKQVQPADPDARTKFRKDFNTAAMRCITRAYRITQEQREKGVSGSTALVVVGYRDQCASEIEEWMKKQGVRETKQRVAPRKLTAGTIAGALAGDRVRLQEVVK